jgi:hypothetical protein
MGAVVPVLMLALALAGVPAPAAAAQPAGAPEATIVEEVVAVVRSPTGAPPRPVTLSRLTEEARIVLVSRGAVDAAFRPIDDRALGATLEWLVDQLLLSDEAARLQIAEVSRDQAAAELGRFRARLGDEAAWARFLASTGLTEDEVAAVLARMLRVDRYLETRLGKGGAVEDAEVVAYARERKLSIESRAGREAVRARVAEQRLEAALQALLAELRSRADVRIIEPRLAPAGKGS